MASGAQPGQDKPASEVVAQPRQNAVLVFGATGRLGQEVVTEVCHEWLLHPSVACITLCDLHMPASCYP